MFEWLFRLFKREPALPAASSVPVIPVDALGPAPMRFAYHDGEKYPGGFGPTLVLLTDYWTLRERSAQLFKTNPYARGLIRRLITNEINDGLHLEATPIERLLGYPEDALAPWTEDVEDRWHLWAKEPWLCDYKEQQTFGALQREVRQEALIEGDVLVLLRQHPKTQLPRVQLISGRAVQTPMDAQPRQGNRIVHGVELDERNRHVAYWVRQLDGGMKRVPAWGEKSGRRIAWLVYGTDKRMDDVRGEPLLSLVLQCLREVDRYRDATLRKAVVNSMLAMFIQKDQEKLGPKPITGGAIRRETVTVADSAGSPRSFRAAELIPGLVIEELSPGEEPKAFITQGTVESFGEFEEAIIQTVAWCHNVPPEILRLSFSNNYSASQAAINEFKVYLNVVRTWFGEGFCQPIYVEWLISSALSGKVTAPGLLDALRDSSKYDVFGAWTSADWTGHIKPAVDISKLVRGYTEMVREGFITRDRAARELTGTKYSKNVQKLRLENEALAEANALILAVESPQGPVSGAPGQDGGEAEGGQDGADEGASEES